VQAPTSTANVGVSAVWLEQGAPSFQLKQIGTSTFLFEPLVGRSGDEGWLVARQRPYMVRLIGLI